MEWLWWIALAVLFSLVEVVTLTFVLLMLAGGALVGALAAAVGLPFIVQVLVFAAVSVVLLVTVRRWFIKRFREQTPQTLTNADALVGRVAVALSPVSGTNGQIKLGGEVWTARTPDDTPAIVVGDRVRIVRIEGATAVVEPVTADI